MFFLYGFITSLLTFAGTELGPPGQFVFGKCGQNITLSFNAHPMFVRFVFAATPFKGTNVTKIETGGVLINIKPDFSFETNSQNALIGKRDKCFNCAGSVTFANAQGILVFDHLRVQAYIPKKYAMDGKFSPGDPDSICSVSVDGFDGALYFGAAIAVLTAIGLGAYLKHFISALLVHRKYQRVANDVRQD